MIKIVEKIYAGFVITSPPESSTHFYENQSRACPSTTPKHHAKLPGQPLPWHLSVLEDVHRYRREPYRMSEGE